MDDKDRTLSLFCVQVNVLLLRQSESQNDKSCTSFVYLKNRCILGILKEKEK